MPPKTDYKITNSKIACLIRLTTKNEALSCKTFGALSAVKFKLSKQRVA